MQRTPINPWSWSTNLGFDQAELVEGHRRQLFCSGQDSVDADGTPQHAGDMAAQIDQAIDNLDAVLVAADMTLADVVRLNVYTTDVDELFRHFDRLPERVGTTGTPSTTGATGGRFATTVLGVSRLPAPQLLVLLEATAVA